MVESQPILRRATRQILVGAVPIGSGAPIAVQSMTKTHTADVGATVRQILALERLGCRIIRCAVPDLAAADALADIRRRIHIPLVADIHFDHRLALRALERGADAIRINPGNLRGRRPLDAVIAALRDTGKSVRIGVNSGSIRSRRPRTDPLVAAMVEAALRYCDDFERRGVSQIKVSLKASDVAATLAANRLFAARTDYPLHLGVTEAGPAKRALVKSAIGIGALLAEGLGDTIRVSMTGPPAEEVRAGYEILRALNLEPEGINLISCPTCGRCRVDLVRVVREVERALRLSQPPGFRRPCEARLGEAAPRPLTVAVMGCEVNGPGEAAEADIGIAAGRGAALLFRRGRPVRKVPEGQLVPELLAEIEKMRNGVE
jgi:(E)-4-hydroxy-3-methylbut-2-enyl-diphosphate synthase